LTGSSQFDEVGVINMSTARENWQRQLQIKQKFVEDMKYLTGP